MNSKPLILSAVAGLAMLGATGHAAAQDPTIIMLTQTACQFLEIENRDHKFSSSSPRDCQAINQRTGAERLASAKTLRLKPGVYVFRVKNENVPYDLGFWLRGEGLLNRARLPSASGGGLKTGATQDFVVELTAGNYLYSCPLNPTPNYRLVVEG